MLDSKAGWELARRGIYVRQMIEGFREWEAVGYPVEVSEQVSAEAG